MKGLVFRSYLQFVEDNFGIEAVEQMIDQSKLPSNAAYSNVGTYSHDEILTMVGVLCNMKGLNPTDAVKLFGYDLFNKLAIAHKDMVAQCDNPCDFLDALDNIIHREVKKLYSNAELPSIGVKINEGKHIVLEYESSRPFADLAHGLIQSCFDHYQKKCEIEKQDLPPNDGTKAIFNISVLD